MNLTIKIIRRLHEFMERHKRVFGYYFTNIYGIQL